jgi:hypothetical protein
MAQHRRTRCDGYLVYRRSIGVRLTRLRTYLRRPRQVLIAGCMMLDQVASLFGMPRSITSPIFLRGSSKEAFIRQMGHGPISLQRAVR